MSRSSILRTLTLTPDGAMPADAMPRELAALGVEAARKGGPIVFAWRVAFVDVDGAAVVGGTIETPDTGTATVQWYSVAFADREAIAAMKAGPYAVREQPAIKTQALGDPVVAVGGAAEAEKTIAGAGYPWPRVTAMTEPEVLPKSQRLTVGGSGAGDYSIQVNATTALVYTKQLGDDAEAIRDGLVALFAGNLLVSAAADGDEVDQLVITGLTAGVNFTLTLVSPSSVLTQAAEQDLRSVAVGLNVYMIIDRPTV